MLSDLSELAAVVFMFIMSPVLERIPVFRATPARWKPVVVSALALVVSAVVLWFRAGAGEGVSAAGLAGAIWTALLGLIACTTGYTMMVVPFGDQASREFLDVRLRGMPPADTSYEKFKSILLDPSAAIRRSELRFTRQQGVDGVEVADMVADAARRGME